MGADNWTICPKCKARHGIERAKLVQDLDELYGKVSRDEYKALETKLAETPEDYDKYEFAEYYEFYLDDDGGFLADYHGTCRNDECDFEFRFKEERRVDIDL